MAKKDLPCCGCGSMMWRGATSAPEGEAMCLACRRASHGYRGYKRGCRCEACRAGVAGQMRAYVASRIERDGAAPTTAARREARGVDPAMRPSCYVCGEEMSIVRDPGNPRPMHSKCRWLIPEWQRKPGGVSPGRRRFLARAERASKGSPASGRVFVQGPCSWCEEPFCSPSGRYCSKSCSRHAAEARKSPMRFKPTPRLRREVYERDGWLCGLCDLPIDPNLRWPDKWSASLDHIVPQSHMLIPDHSASNLRAVHLQCNSMRGDGSNMSEDELRSRASAELGGGRLGSNPRVSTPHTSPFACSPHTG